MSRSIFSQNTIKKIVPPMASFLISIIIYLLVLWIPIPQAIGFNARYGFFIVIIPICFLLYFAYQKKGWIGITLSLSLTLVLFALPLSGVWSNSISDGSIIGGLLPWSDASGYYGDARRLLEGDRVQPFSSRRPLFTGVLAVILGLTQQNLQITFAIFVAVSALSCFFLSREIKKSYGAIGGLFVIVVLFTFYRRFAGTTLTENLGFPLGVLGFTILWRGVLQQYKLYCCLGIFVMTLALNARAGAFFVLPAVVLWGMWFFRKGNRPSMSFLLGSLGAIFLGFFLNQLLFKTIGDPSGATFSNFAHTLYGLVSGGQDWTQILKDNPGVQENQMYALAFEAFWKNPWGIIQGSIKAWQLYFDPNQLGAFSFINVKFHPLTTERIRRFFYFVSLLGFCTCFCQFKRPESSLMIALSFGILLSVPFVPPWDADSMRAYAATIPISATLPTCILGFELNQKRENFARNFPLRFDPLLFFGISFALFSVFAPITTKLLSKPANFSEITCPNSTEPIYLALNSGSLIELVNDDFSHSYIPKIRISDFKKGMAEFATGYPEIAEELTNQDIISHSVISHNGIDLKTKRHVWLFANSELLSDRNGIMAICGSVEDKSPLQPYGGFYVESIEKVGDL
ncbi:MULTISPECIES: hypothetical protein [Spirulina sp. CCY15215]|uniref:hypothetical protein n=1 Tax=Spirulina sp. CCY15215 TaxID=2767591 RepID=UPI0019522500|nr:hypothetical protein [Spirulina major]